MKGTPIFHISIFHIYRARKEAKGNQCFAQSLFFLSSKHKESYMYTHLKISDWFLIVVYALTILMTFNNVVSTWHFVDISSITTYGPWTTLLTSANLKFSVLQSYIQLKIVIQIYDNSMLMCKRGRFLRIFLKDILFSEFFSQNV